MSQGYNSLCLPLYLHGRIIPRIVVISCISMCIINHILHFTSSIFVNSHLWGILWKEKKKNTVIYTYLHVYFTGTCFPSGRSMFLSSVTILLPEKYPLPFLVVQVFGQPNFSVFIYLKKFFFILPCFQGYFHWMEQWVKRTWVCFPFFLLAF